MSEAVVVVVVVAVSNLSATTHHDATILLLSPDPLSSFKLARVHGREAGETSYAPPPQNVSTGTSLTPNEAGFGVADCDDTVVVWSSVTRASAETSGGLSVDICPVSVTETSKLTRTMKSSGRRLDQRNYHADAAIS